MAVCSRITPVSQYANVVPQYAQVPVTSSIAAIVSSTKISTQLQQLVDAGLITLDGESDEEPGTSFRKYDFEDL